MNSKTNILLSVIIPTRNRAQSVSNLLETLAFQAPVTFDWEVLVVDNGSTDQTAGIAKQKISALPIEARYIYEPKPGLHNGRHRGALEASGKYLAYLDDDVLLTPTWIHGVDNLISGQAEAVVGRVIPKWEIRPPAWLISFTRGSGSSYYSLLDMGSKGTYIDPKFVYGDNFFIPAKIVFELKGFHPDSMPADQLRYRGDGEYALMMKFRQAGLRAWYDPVASVYHCIPRERISMSYLCKRSYAEGISSSFAKIRALQHQKGNAENQKDNESEPPRSTSYYMNRLRELTLPQLSSILATRIMEHVPLSPANIRQRLRQAYWAGFNYHQNEARRNPELLKWVLQEDYWDCSTEIWPF